MRPEHSFSGSIQLLDSFRDCDCDHTALTVRRPRLVTSSFWHFVTHEGGAFQALRNQGCSWGLKPPDSSRDLAM